MKKYKPYLRPLLGVILFPVLPFMVLFGILYFVFDQMGMLVWSDDGEDK